MATNDDFPGREAESIEEARLEIERERLRVEKEKLEIERTKAQWTAGSVLLSALLALLAYSKRS